MFLTAILDCATSHMPVTPAETAEVTKAAMTVVLPVAQVSEKLSHGKDRRTCSRGTLDNSCTGVIGVGKHGLHSELLGVIERAE